MSDGKNDNRNKDAARSSQTNGGTRKLSKRFPAAWPSPPSSSDCDRPACAEIGKALQQHGFGDLNGIFSSEQIPKTRNVDTKQCPPNSAELGVGTWKLLHSMVCRHEALLMFSQLLHVANLALLF